MKLAAIHWHDSRIRQVIERPAQNELIFEVDYPIDWEAGLFEPRAIRFLDVHTYEIHEGPFAGAPTILEASVTDEDEYGNWAVRIETNAGYRVVRCQAVQLTDPAAPTAPA